MSRRHETACDSGRMYLCTQLKEASEGKSCSTSFGLHTLFQEESPPPQEVRPFVCDSVGALGYKRA